MIRVFIAISIPEDILIRCQKLVVHLQKLTLKGTFSRKDSIHLTLKFLGNIDEKKIPNITEKLRQVARVAVPFQLDIQGLGVFPNLANPRIICVGIAQSPDLYRLKREIEEQLEVLGFHLETRDFNPHLTLARLKSRKNLSELRNCLTQRESNEAIGTMKVRAVHLFQSILRPMGAEYRKLVTVTLGSSSNDVC